MKNLLITLSLSLFSVLGFSQSTSKISEPRVFTRAQLIEMKSINELVPESFKDKSFIVIDIVGRINAEQIAADCEGNELTEEMKSILKKADTGTKIYFDTKYIDQKSNPATLNVFTFAIKVG